MNETTRVGIVGCGVISRAYARKIATFPALDLVACADLVPARAEELAELANIARPCTVDELLPDPSIDVVVNLTVPLAHAEVSAAAIAAGKSVYGEKPLATDRAAGLGLVASAEKAGVRLGCAPDTFMGGGLQTCRKLIDDGAIGEPVGATAFMLQGGPERWHPRPEFFYQAGGGPMLDMGPYSVTALVSLLGPIKRVTGTARITHDKRTTATGPEAGSVFGVKVPTHVCGVMELESGPVCTMVMSFDVQASTLPKIEIYGTRGTLLVPDPNTFGGPVRLRTSADEAWTEVPLTHPHQSQSRGIGLADMAHAMRSGRPHRASGEMAAHVLDVMLGIIDASESRSHVEMTTTCKRPAAIPEDLPEDRFE